MNTRIAEQIADAVLYEGYVLYPYRASAAKNRFRWQVGIVTPRDYAEACGSDPWFMQTECLAEIEPGAALAVRVRALHVQERTVEQAVGGGSTWHAVETLTVDDQQLIAWDEAVLSEFVRDGVPLDDAPQTWSGPWLLDAACERELVHDRSGALAARVVRRRRPVTSAVRIETEPHGPFLKVRVRVENLTPCESTTLAGRDLAVRHALAGTHTMLAITNGAFVSLLDPPPAAMAAAASCRNVNTFPVLAGPPGSRSVVLSSPIILYDYPVIAPESPGDFCDATEIDEMLMLRVQTLTDDEKREARATDSRAARIIDRGDAASAGAMAQLHGAIRHLADAPLDGWLAGRSSSGGAMSEGWQEFLNPANDAPPEEASLVIGTVRLQRGSRVRLEPTRSADSMDICLRGRMATVTAVYRTLEDRPYVAVSLDDDPVGAETARYRRALFFHPDELVPQ